MRHKKTNRFKLITRIITINADNTKNYNYYAQYFRYNKDKKKYEPRNNSPLRKVIIVADYKVPFYNFDIKSSQTNNPAKMNNRSISIFFDDHKPIKYYYTTTSLNEEKALIFHHEKISYEQKNITVNKHTKAQQPPRRKSPRLTFNLKQNTVKYFDKNSAVISEPSKNDKQPEVQPQGSISKNTLTGDTNASPKTITLASQKNSSHDIKIDYISKVTQQFNKRYQAIRNNNRRSCRLFIYGNRSTTKNTWDLEKIIRYAAGIDPDNSILKSGHRTKTILMNMLDDNDKSSTRKLLKSMFHLRYNQKAVNKAVDEITDKLINSYIASQNKVATQAKAYR